MLVDASESDYNIDVGAAAAAVGPRTRFVVPVHLYGQLADMQAIGQLARRNDLVVVEDACQAHGATRNGVAAGQAGSFGAFSFYPAKNLGAFGDAGAVVTSDDELAERVRVLREHGQRLKYEHELEGYTSRLDTLQALVLLRKLPLLDAWNAQRREAAALLQREPCGHRRPCDSAGRGRERAGVAPVSDPDAVSRPGSASTSRRGGSRRAATTRSRSTSRRPSRGSGTCAATSPSPRRSPTSCSRCPSTRASPSSSSPRSSRRSVSSSAVADAPANDAPHRLLDDVAFGEDVVVRSFTNLYGCRIGDGTHVGTFVEIQRGAAIGARCKIQSHTFICDGVEIEDEVFVGHGVMFVNDTFPRATTADGSRQADGDWELVRTRIRRGASLGSGAVVLGGIEVGEGAIVGAGAVVTARRSRLDDRRWGPRTRPARARASTAVRNSWRALELEGETGRPVNPLNHALQAVRYRVPTA